MPKTYNIGAGRSGEFRVKRNIGGVFRVPGSSKLGQKGRSREKK
jgi:hypothetical protein